MKHSQRLHRIAPAALALAAAGWAASTAQAQFVTTPNNMNDITGNAGISNAFFVAPATWQGVISKSEFNDLKAGDRITGIQWRAMSNQFSVPSFPPVSGLDWAAFDIYTSSAATTPATMSNTFALNDGPDFMQVRGGPYTLNPNSYINNGVQGTISPWGPVISFDSPYEYRGGDIAITIRHSGFFGPFDSFAFDAIFPIPDPPRPEYGTLVAGRTASGYAAPTGGGPGFFVTRFGFEPIPEPATLTLLALAATRLRTRRRAPGRAQAPQSLFLRPAPAPQ